MSFDPNRHLRRLSGRGGASEYLDVKWRLVWLRSEHPNARIETFLRDGGIEHNYAVFEARVNVPDGGSATGWGSETKADFGDFLEKAETKALGRALAALGYGTQFAPDLDEGHRLVDSPRERARGNVPAEPPSHEAPTGAAAGPTERSAPPPRRMTSGSPAASPFPAPASPPATGARGTHAAAPPTSGGEEHYATIEDACGAMSAAASLADLTHVYNVAKHQFPNDYDTLVSEYKRLARQHQGLAPQETRA